MTSISIFLSLEICWLSTSWIFSSNLLCHIILAGDVLCDIFLFMLSIYLFNLVSLSSYQIEHFTILKAIYLIGQPARMEEKNLVTYSIQLSHLFRWLSKVPNLIVYLIITSFLLTIWKISLSKIKFPIKNLILVVSLQGLLCSITPLRLSLRFLLQFLPWSLLINYLHNS